MGDNAQKAVKRLFQNNYQQDDTCRLSFISGLVVLHSTCFELQGAHHQEFHFLLYRQPLAYCVIFCCTPPVLLSVGNRTLRRTGGVQQKITQYARGCLYSKKVKLLMMSSLQLETCRVKDD